jgi:hypothetical protein
MARISDVYGGSYLKAEDLKGREVGVTIDEVTYTKVDEKKRAVLHFVGKDKQLLLNVTNANMIAELLGSDEMDEWVGKRLTLYTARVDFQGKRVDAIRVKKYKPSAAAAKSKQQPEPEPEAPDDELPDNTPDYDSDEPPF